MIEILVISLENEMDLVLAHKRSMQVGEEIGLTVATRTTFATAVSEVSRTVIEYTDNGRFTICIEGAFPRFALKAKIVFTSDQTFKETDEGFFYAKKLLPDFEFQVSDNVYSIEMGLGIPRSLKIDKAKIHLLRSFFEQVAPMNSYEEIKNRNHELNRLTEVQELEIRRQWEIDEQKKEFISIASHELKTPITIIKAYAQVLRVMKGQYSEKVGEMLNKLDIQAGKLTTLAQQLMDVSKMEKGSLQYDLEEIVYNDFIMDTVDILSTVYPDNKFNIDLCETCIINGDKLRLEQVFTNLLGNAVKYSGKKSAINIKTELIDSSVRTAVQDYGIGMSENGLANIFDKFFRQEQVTASHPGLGMGLYITSKIIDDHGGKIWVDSEHGAGSIFFFTIPLA